MACPITAVNLALPEGEWSHGPAATVLQSSMLPTTRRAVCGLSWLR